MFATKNREPLILTPELPRLHGYLVAVLRELGCPSLYASFSVGRSELEHVRRCILGQRGHRREHSFEHELRALCGREPADTAALDEFLHQEPHRGGTP